MEHELVQEAKKKLAKREREAKVDKIIHELSNIKGFKIEGKKYMSFIVGSRKRIEEIVKEEV